ncbi:hypothetical protein N8A98_07110 [Devosia neptuniae]|uniref:Uncharacterized protein n=1 Tax=Devosia neptuniae TaxID=191302 RepID=A0ABY6CFD7_9HYPH|nr:hypothetical protein [Devosia neptuniae]UXN70951.1 hypothetical protein N8A98_07110 [Devosia neptuniae]
MVSGGAGSWLAAKVDMAAHPSDDHRFVFADTLYEDADCYRFLIEGVAHLLGRRLNWPIPSADDFPDYRVEGEFDIATYAGNPIWRAFLADLREQITSALPELVWLADGRDPWEVFRDGRFLGNSRIDPCSKSLKRVMLDAYRVENCDPTTSVFQIGIGPHEAHRYHRLAARMAADGWKYEAPLLGTREGEFGPFGYLSDAGIDRPRLYRLGYMHNNCGGFCIKAGHAHYLNRLRQQPERFAYDAMMEQKLSEFIGKPVSMLTDRSGDGSKKLLTLSSFAASVTAQTEFDFLPGDSGCGCMIDIPANDNETATPESDAA